MTIPDPANPANPYGATAPPSSQWNLGTEPEIAVAPQSAGGGRPEPDIAVNNAYNPYGAAPVAQGVLITEPDIVVASPTAGRPTEAYTNFTKLDAQQEPDIQLVSSVVPYGSPTTTTTAIVSAAGTDTAVTTASLVAGHDMQLLPFFPTGKEYRMIVKPNLWLSSESEMVVATYADSGQPLPVRLQSEVGTGSRQTKLVVMDHDKQPRAVLRKNDPNNPDKFHIFGLRPCVPNQKPSITMTYTDGRPLYTWGSLTNADGLLPYSSAREYYIRMQNGWQYTAKREGGGGGLFGGRNNNNKPKRFTVTVGTHATIVGQRNVHSHASAGSLYATMEHPGPNQNWNIHVRSFPDHDPGLMVVFALLLDELHLSRMK